ncbi:MAG: serine/threonine protein kinase, partial [Planctomycetota bacterium]
GPPSDLYSLGCTLYYACTGKVPFPGGDSRSKCRRHCEQTPWHPRKFAPELTEDFVDVIADMMEKDPGRRIATANEVAERLEPWAQSDLDVVDRPIVRQSWTPPPPPIDPAGLRDQPISRPDDIAEGSSHGSGGLQAIPVDTTQKPPLPGGGSSESVASIPIIHTAPKPSHSLAIAITLAIAVPLCLLVGAIIGFMVRGELHLP